MVPVVPDGLTARAEGRAASPAPAARSAATTAAAPRIGRSRRFVDGYDILVSSRGARGCGRDGGTAGSTAGVAPLWPAFGTQQTGRPRTPGRVLGLRMDTRGLPRIPAV